MGWCALFLLFSQLRHQADAGSSEGVQLGDDTLKQAAWAVINKNTVGVWPPVSQVGGTDVLQPINEVRSARPRSCDEAHGIMRYRSRTSRQTTRPSFRSHSTAYSRWHPSLRRQASFPWRVRLRQSRLRRKNHPASPRYAGHRRREACARVSPCGGRRGGRKKSRSRARDGCEGRFASEFVVGSHIFGLFQLRTLLVNDLLSLHRRKPQCGVDCKTEHHDEVAHHTFNLYCQQGYCQLRIIVNTPGCARIEQGSGGSRRCSHDSRRLH
jgi:hypothetical protein